jgi:glycosyltransferase involved in cell wall biosynthesis
MSQSSTLAAPRISLQPAVDPGQRKVLISAWTYGETVSEAYTAFSLVQSLKALGWRPFVLTWAAPWNSENWYGVGQIKCWTRYREFWAPLYAEYLARSHRVARRIYKDFSLIHQASPITLRTPSTLGLLDRPFLWGPVGGSIPYPPGFEHYDTSASGVLRRLDRLRLKADPSMILTMRTAQCIVATTTMCAANIPDRYQSKVRVVPAGISPSVIATGAPEEHPYIMSSGRFVPYKALELLIRAFARLRGAESLKLIISGDGPLRPQLEAVIAELNLGERVVLRGLISKKQNQQLMKNALFCAFPALREAFGHVYLEAMAAWKPVVATDWGGPRDLVDDGVTGFKVLGRNPDEHVELFADRMQRLVDDRDLRQKMSRAAARRVSQLYTWPAVGERYDGIYRSLL